TVVDAPDALLLSTGNETAATAATDGSNFLVAWSDGRDSGGPFIYANGVTATGVHLSGTDHRVSELIGAGNVHVPYQASQAAASWGASGWLVAYTVTKGYAGANGGVWLSKLD